MAKGNDFQNDALSAMRLQLQAGRLNRRDLLRAASVLGIALPLATSGMGLFSRAARAEGSVLRVAAQADDSELEPVSSPSVGAVCVAQQIAEYLVWCDADLIVRPMLATSWTPAGSAKEWDVNLREDVLFNDGSPLTSADVVATFDRIFDPQSNASALNSLKGLMSAGAVEATGTHSVRFHLDRPVVDFAYFISNVTYGSMILPKGYKMHTFAQSPVGTGPYLLKEYRPTQGATLVRNPKYWGQGEPKFDQIEFIYYKDVAPQSLALQSGEIDMMMETPFLDSQALLSDPSIKFVYNKSASYRAVHMRTDQAPFNDKRVRQAIASCLDRTAIVGLLFGGRADIGNDTGFAPIYPSSPALAPRKQDYELAKKLLADAGHGDGLTVELTAVTFQEVPQYATILREMAAPAGITINIREMAFDAYYGTGDPWLNLPFAITDWGPRATPSQLLSAAYTCNAQWTSSHWCNNDFDQLLASFDAEVDPLKRKDIAAKMAALQMDEVPSIIAYFLNQSRAMKASLMDVGPTTTNVLDVRKAHFA
ncbi:MAG TPA: ABC transporter substrate-binding protein [Bauldia sp.]|nr:ABC transporter substrate-binding protein [Bauldia sp.]